MRALNISQLSAQESLTPATARDFGKGLNVADDDLNMSADYSVVMDNVGTNDSKGIDVRQGTRIFANGEDGTITENGSVTITVAVTNASNVATITDTAHGLSTGEHVELSSFSAAIGGIDASEFNKRHCITVLSANSYSIRTASDATSTTSASRTATQTYNTHTIAGTIINKWHFQNHDIIVDTTGELFKVDGAGTITRIFDDTVARGLSGSPSAWSPMTFADADTFKGDLIVCNGIDKPLLVNLDNGSPVTFLQDAGSSSNVNTPVAKYVIAMPDYLCMAGDLQNNTILHVSDTGTSGTWQGDPSPNVGTQVDLSVYSPSSDPEIRGLGRYREQLIVAFVDSVVPIELGNIDTTPAHIIEPSDAIEQHGAIAARSIVSLGSDLLMCDTTGVPSFARRVFTDSLESDRPSEDIDKLLRNNVLRLTIGAQERDIFALYNRLDRQYMLFMPNHETGSTLNMRYNSLEAGEAASGEMYLHYRAPHNFRVGETFTISGATAFGGLTTGNINKTHTVLRVIDEHIIVVDTGGTVTSARIGGGGGSIILTYQRTQTLCYVYKKLTKRSIRAWSVYSGWNWNCGSVTSLGRVIFASDRKLYVLGNENDPINGDFVDEFDATWAVSTAYTEGQRIKSPTSGVVFECVSSHTSDASGTMEDNIARVPTYWIEYRGEPIDFVWELPWIDNNRKMNTKKNKLIAMDTVGNAIFKAQIFTDQQYSDGDGGLSPIFDIEFVAGNGGFGSSQSVSGSARLTGDARAWRCAFSYKIMKWRFYGSTTRACRFISVSLAYKLGGMTR